jgi:hypothetical protein
MSDIAEGVRQLRGTSVNRAPMSSTFSVAAGTGGVASDGGVTDTENGNATGGKGGKA